MLSVHRLFAPQLPRTRSKRRSISQRLLRRCNCRLQRNGEVTGTNYVAGGVAVTTATAPTSTGTTAFFTPSASIVYTNVTLATAFDAVLIYNDTAAGKNAVSVHTFGSQTVTAGTFTLTMPANDATNALIRIA